ncbi:hypothetical protein EC973_009000 [Apophysomyces ossiformis]|uniref:Complex 1 LYR protein domain-containing protein n=1 Tax=Apophysomyces ossiformis TaxID=679940 RepID=A0A8H7BM76_9FUNG|nr:hypothetical protein EC973_009000 [Apophysomyces ossiformis]
MSTPATRAQVLALYRQFFRHGNKFASYNFRDYALRRSRDAFRANAAETDPAKIAACIEKAQKELDILKRQASISTLYTRGEKLVIEKK